MKDIRVFSIICMLFFISMFSFFPGSAQADPLATWKRVTAVTDNWYYGMTYGNGFFVTVGDYGSILTSADGGVTWTPHTSGDTHHLFGVGYGNNTYIAVGTVGTILTSSGAPNWSWTLRPSGTGRYLYSVAHDGNNRFVVVGASGTILTSTNSGATWRRCTSPTNNWLFGAVYGWEFAAVGSYDGNPASSELLTSTDGTTWLQQSSGTTKHLLGVAYGAGRFVAVGEKGVILSSTNGTTWVMRRPPLSENEDLLGIAYGVVNSIGYFVAVGKSGIVLTSPDTDLVTWTPRDSGTTYDLQAVAFDNTNSAFAAVGGYGTIVLDGESLPTAPVKISQPYEVFFETIQDAYNNATAGDVDIMALLFYENLTFNSDKTVSLKGGYNSTFSDNPSYTTLNGSLTISNGTITVDKIIIQ